MPRFGSRERDTHGLRITHFADDYHIRSLPQRGAERRRKVRSVDADFHLLNQAGGVRVLVLDRVFDGHDVPGHPPVDLLDQGGQRRGFAGAGRPANQHQPTRQLREQFHLRRQVE